MQPGPFKAAAEVVGAQGACAAPAPALHKALSRVKAWYLRQQTHLIKWASSQEPATGSRREVVLLLSSCTFASKQHNTWLNQACGRGHAGTGFGADQGLYSGLHAGVSISVAQLGGAALVERLGLKRLVPIAVRPPQSSLCSRPRSYVLMNLCEGSRLWVQSA